MAALFHFSLASAGNIKRGINRIALVLGSLAALLLAGCTTEKIADYQLAAPAATERMVRQSGLEIAVDPFIEDGRTHKYFDIDAVGDGIAILHVRIVNNTTDQTFLVEKKDFQLCPNGAASGLANGGERNDQAREGSDKLAGSEEWAGAVLGGVGGTGLYLAGLTLASKSSEIQRNFTGKEMADATLSPGKQMEGFIYFAPVPKGKDWTNGAAVKVNLTDTKTQQAVSWNIPFSH